MNSNNPFTTYGRTSRTRYVAAIVGLFFLWLIARSAVTVFTPGEAFFRVILSVLILWPAYCISVMRLHDADRTSLLALGILATAILGMLIEATLDTLAFDQGSTDALIAIPSLATMFGVLAIAVMRPTRGPNRYGDDPRGPVDARTRSAELETHES